MDTPLGGGAGHNLTDPSRVSDAVESSSTPASVYPLIKNSLGRRTISPMGTAPPPSFSSLPDSVPLFTPELEGGFRRSTLQLRINFLYICYCFQMVLQLFNRSMVNAKLSQQRFRTCYKNGLPLQRSMSQDSAGIAVRSS